MKNLQLTKEQITQIVAVIFFGGVFGYLYIAYFWIPTAKNIETKNRKISELQNKIDKAKRRDAQYKNLSAKLEQLKKDKEAAQKKLPRGKKIPDLIKKLTEISKKHHINIASISPGSSKKERYFLKVLYSISARGNYHDFGRFFAELALQERIFTLENVRINASSGDYSASVTFSLVAYQYST